jgi:spore maturation protein CgeB
MINGPVLRRVQQSDPDLVWVNQGEFLGPKLLQQLRALSIPIVNYTNDDPFGGHRNALRFRLYLKALSYYDLLAVVRMANVQEAILHGAQRVVRVFMSADEEAHRPQDVTPEDRARYGCEVAFVGTWMPERGPFIAELIRLGVPLSIWGDRWRKAREWPVIESYWRGPGLHDERYAKIIRSAKVVLGLLSKSNRDLHTQRTMEIPALGAVLCAERTSEHLLLYDDGVEAVFWTTPEECAAACRRLLADEVWRQSVARRGRERLQRNGHYNEQVLAAILKELAPAVPKAVQ